MLIHYAVTTSYVCTRAILLFWRDMLYRDMLYRLYHKRECVQRNNGCFGGVTFTVSNQLHGVRCVESEVVALVKQNAMHYNRKSFEAALK